MMSNKTKICIIDFNVLGTAAGPSFQVEIGGLGMQGFVKIFLTYVYINFVF